MVTSKRRRRLVLQASSAVPLSAEAYKHASQATPVLHLSNIRNVFWGSRRLATPPGCCFEDTTPIEALMVGGWDRGLFY